MATKKPPARRTKAGSTAGRARTTTRKTAAKKKAPARARTTKATARKATATKSAAKPSGRKKSNVAVVTRRASTVLTSNRIPRRAVFIDVENTSSEDDLFEVIEALKIDRAAQPTQVAAVGNWRAIGQRLGRRLAAMGAQLMHSAPATGVRDWSDLWIAVAAGCWLGEAEPGDLLEIVSNDRAFDAVGDAAAARGVNYRRLLHKRGALAAAATTVADEEEPKRRRRSRGGRRRRGRGTGTAPAPAPEERAAAPAQEAPAPTRTAQHAPAPSRTAQPKPAHRAPSHPPLHDVEAHGAPRDQIVSTIGRLSGHDPHRWINLDVLEKALKSEGFARPPGSPRLVTRLRMLKDIEVDSHGRARLAPHATPPESAPPPASEKAAPEEAAAEAAAPAKKPRTRRRRKTSSSGESGDSPSAEAAPFAAAAAYSEPPAE